jgi:D-alanine-D-alanine ligase
MMKVAVLLGGDSAERDVSLASGKGIIEALRSRGHDASAVDPAMDGGEAAATVSAAIAAEPPRDVPRLDSARALGWLTAPRVAEADVVFIALHGGAGEDGTVQALLETIGAAYTGTGVLGSALAMNKDRSKALFREAGVNTAPHLLLRADAVGDAERIAAEIGERIGYPAVVKPNCQGSSVGFSFVERASQVAGAVERGAAFGDELVVERYIAGREITAAVLDGEALPLVEIIPEGGFYDYTRKYTKGTSRYVVPAEIDASTAGRIQREAVRAYRALVCRDYARVDMRLGEDGEPYCLEVNTLPGMTGLSLVPMAAAKAGIPFGELVERICVMALERDRRCTGHSIGR